MNLHRISYNLHRSVKLSINIVLSTNYQIYLNGYYKEQNVNNVNLCKLTNKF